MSDDKITQAEIDGMREYLKKAFARLQNREVDDKILYDSLVLSKYIELQMINGGRLPELD